MAEDGEKLAAPAGEGGGGGAGRGDDEQDAVESVKLFVGQVPKHMTEAELAAMFQEVALVDEVTVIKNKTTKASRGCCFLICPSRDEADKAVNEFHNKRTLPGASSPLQVIYADGELERLEHKLFIGMLPKNVSDTELTDLFSKYGNIKDLQILRGSQQTSKAGCAFLKYETKEQAMAAIEAVNGKHKIEGSSVPLVVKWADTEKERQARKAQKAQLPPPNMPNGGPMPHSSAFVALQMGYMPPYNGFSYQPPGTYGIMQYPLSPMQNQAPFQNMVQPVNQGNSIRGINPELSLNPVPRSFHAMQLGRPYPAVPGMPYTGSYPGGLMNNRPFGNSHNSLKVPSVKVNFTPFSPGSNVGGHTQTEGGDGCSGILIPGALVEDPGSASPSLAMEDPAPSSLQGEVMADPDLTSPESAMEDPITASIGSVGPLLRKLHSIGPEDEMRPLMDLCISLKNLSEDKDTSSTNRRWMKIARELVYDAEDHLDTASGAGACHDFSELLARVKDASKRRQRFQWSPPQTIKSSERGEAGVSRLTSNPEPSIPICAVSLSKCVVELPKKLVDLLALDHVKKTLKVIPIIGCAGVGKTTVARALYHNHGGKFQCRAFVAVSRNLDMRAFLTTVLSQLKAPRPHGFPDVPNLIDAIRKYLQDKRYLIVVDDLWTASVWDIISSAFPHGDSCSRIITTTQIDDVALACCSYDSDYIYKMEPLNDHESRNLFFSRVFGSEDGCPTEIKEVSYKIIRKCGGLPLAIVNVASILASESNIVKEKWKHIQDSLPSEGMKDVLNLIYNSLPARLRTCLLYLSMYPQNCVIKKAELVKHWVAEGFISAMGGGDAEEIAGGYFDVLLSRGLVQAVDANNNGEVLSCTVHQMVLDFISCKSLEQNFVINVDYFQSTLALPDKVRRLSVQFGGVKSAYIPESIITSHVRSLIFCGFFKCVPSIADFGLLRVLILHIWADRDKKSFDLTTIGKLYQLKYIKIECNITVKLPSKIRRLQHLGTLHVDARLSAVPSDIVILERLLHLCLPSDSILPSVVAHLTSLRTLGYFDLSSLSEEDVSHLGGLTNLQDLQLTCSTVQPAENLEKNMRHLCSILEKLRVLQSLTLVPASSSSCAASAMIPYDSFNMVSPPPDLLLRRIELSQRSCIFFSLPKWFGELRKLCILKIAIRQLGKEDFDILKGILSLTALTLYIQTAPTKRIVIAKGGFQVLTYFKFMCAAPCLFFEQGAMPKVQKLKLGFNSDKMKTYSLGVVGFHYLTGLIDICVKFGVQDGEEFNIRGAESALKAAFSNCPNTCIIRVQRKDVILDGKEHTTIVTDEKGDTTYVYRHDIQDQSQLIQEERDPLKKYEPVRKIGSGNFGVAQLMRNRDTRELVAMKFIERGYRIDENVFREIVNHRALRHPNIIRFKEVLLTPTHLGIVMEYAAGGELFERICNAGRFSEDEALYFFQQLVCGVSFCHAMQICHRDLKLENVLLDGSPAPRLKICDFGYSKSSVLHSRPKSTVGRPVYIAPEVLSRREYDGKRADVWSCGVTLYTMLVGDYPFGDTKDPKNFRKTITRIMSVQYKIPEYVRLSQDCRHLLSQIFVADPRKRITMAEIKAHPWFLKDLPHELMEGAQQAYYNRRHAEVAASPSAGGISASGATLASYSAQSVEEIMKIVQEAQSVPKPNKPVSEYGWGTGHGEAHDDDGNYEEEEHYYGEDEYDKMVREVHATGDFDIGELLN